MFKYIYDFQEYEVDVLLEKIITKQFSGSQITDALINVAGKVYDNADEKVKNMLLSPDEEVAFVGQQMLFTDYLDLYNTLIKVPFYKTMMSSIFKILTSNYNAYETKQ